MQYYFHEFIKKIAIDENNLGEQITEWKECLEDRESIEFVRKSGSTKRGTSIGASSDVDLVVLFHEDKVEKGNITNFFGFAKSEIRKCIDINRDMDHGFANDYIGGTDIDVLIGFSESTEPLVFRIPDKRNNKFVWIETSPDAPKKRIEDANRLTSGKAGQYVRVMKYWNLRNSKCFNSFYLETLVIKKILSDSEKFDVISYPEGINYLFKYLTDAIDKKEPQPSRKGPKLGNLSVDQKKKIKRILEYSIRKSNDALEIEDLQTKIWRWEDIFGYDLTR